MQKSKYLREKHCGWKGDKAGYAAKHIRMTARFGLQKECGNCKILGKYISYMRRGRESKRWSIEWANKSGEYKDEPEDWIGLCKKCHNKMDDITRKCWLIRDRNIKKRKLNCGTCNKEFIIVESRLKYGGGKFCSFVCTPKRNNIKLTEKKVQYIRGLYSARNISQCLLGRLFNVSQATIYNIISRKTWHV